MNGDSPRVYQFDEFQLDADGLALYHRGSLIDAGGKKMLQVLAVFLRNPNKLIAYNDVLDDVWGDGHFGVTSDTVNQYVSQIRGVLAQFEPEREYFKNKKGRGYIFTGEVRSIGENIRPADTNPEKRESESPAKPLRRFSTFVIALTGLLVLIVLFGVWMLYPKNDIEEVKSVVKDSQLYESLVLYKSPSSFQETDLDRYWTSELDVNSNFDRGKIRVAVKKMIDEGRRYGDETKCEQFEFQAVDINTANDMAVVKTLEKWFVAVYQNDGTLLRNRTVGPYFVSYIVRKIDGRWLIEKSNTGRVNRPMPRLSDIEAVSEVKAGQQFFAKITGQDLEIETIFIEITGPGCPESKPCRVSNPVLHEKSKLTDTMLDNVPLTLTSGNFKIVAHNGESPASNPVYIKVP